MSIVDDTIDKKMAQVLDRDDMVTTVMSTFISSTVHCARCHNHKFDPIPRASTTPCKPCSPASIEPIAVRLRPGRLRPSQGAHASKVRSRDLRSEHAAGRRHFASRTRAD